MSQPGTTAYFPGTGPAGRTCKDCAHFAPHRQRSRWGWCGWARRRIRQARPIRDYLESCKYFEIAAPPRRVQVKGTGGPRPIVQVTDHTVRILKHHKETRRPGLTPQQVKWFLANPNRIASPTLARAVRIAAVQMGEGRRDWT